MSSPETEGAEIARCYTAICDGIVDSLPPIEFQVAMMQCAKDIVIARHQALWSNRDYPSPVIPKEAEGSQAELFEQRCAKLTEEFNNLLRTAPQSARHGVTMRVHHTGIPDWYVLDTRVVEEVERRFTAQGWAINHEDEEFWDFTPSQL